MYQLGHPNGHPAGWNAGQVAVFDPRADAWREWRLPGDHPQAYAVYVDERDIVWLSDFGADAIHAFDPTTEKFTTYPKSESGADVRQINGRPGEFTATTTRSIRRRASRRCASGRDR